MFENLKLSNIRIVFLTQNPLEISKVANLLIAFDKILNEMNQKFSIPVTSVLTNSEVTFKFAKFDICLISNNKPLDSNDFYEILDSLINKILNTDYALPLQNLISVNDSIHMISITNDNIMVLKIFGNKSITIEKKPISRPKRKFKCKDDVLSAYNEDKEILLINSSLEKLDLSGINLQHANLSSAELSDSILSSTNLSFSILKHSDISNAKIDSAVLNSVDLEKTDLSGANLSNSDLSNSNLYAVDLSSANLSNAKLNNVDISETDFSSSSLTNTTFSGNIKFDNKTDFSNNANWWDANIEDKNLLNYLKINFPKKN